MKSAVIDVRLENGLDVNVKGDLICCKATFQSRNAELGYFGAAQTPLSMIPK